MALAGLDLGPLASMSHDYYSMALGEIERHHRIKLLAVTRVKGGSADDDDSIFSADGLGRCQNC